MIGLFLCPSLSDVFFLGDVFFLLCSAIHTFLFSRSLSILPSCPSSGHFHECMCWPFPPLFLLFCTLQQSYIFVDSLLAEHDFYQGHHRYILKVLIWIYLYNRKFHLGFLLTNNFLLCDGQFLTPDQLRQFDELSYGARTHYDMTSGRRTDMFNRLNPDYLLRGFYFNTKENYDMIVVYFSRFFSILVISIN